MWGPSPARPVGSSRILPPGGFHATPRRLLAPPAPAQHRPALACQSPGGAAGSGRPPAPSGAGPGPATGPTGSPSAGDSAAPAASRGAPSTQPSGPPQVVRLGTVGSFTDAGFAI